MDCISDTIYKNLNDIVPQMAKLYSSAKPFPHYVINGLFDPVFLKKVSSKFPSNYDGNWWTYDNILEKKLARNDLHTFSPSTRRLICELQSNRFVSMLEKLTGINGLIVDHTLNGGGLHQIIQGGKLDIHADYNYHPITKLDRRVNVLLYLNEEWKTEWKGQLEFWDHEMIRCVRRIEPIFNRMVIFNVTDESNHGHPDPLQCPANVTRKSIALYYYTNGRPAHEISAPHSTIFKRRPEDPIIQEHENLRIKRAQRRLT